MELKHFSHSHGLVFHHVPQGCEIYCSACKSPGSGDVYACWQCSYFLHQHCFRATRSLKHPAHPLHTLTLMPSPTYLSGSFTCNSCNLGGYGLSYSCCECEFDIHVHCALIPNPNPPQTPIYPPHLATYPPQTSLNPSLLIPNNPVYPQPSTTTPLQPPHVVQRSNPTSMIKHFIHPHFLKPDEIEQNKEIVCSACNSDLSGSAYSCTKPHCSFNLHEACFDSPHQVRHQFHPHPLSLIAAPASDYGYGDEYTCEACQEGGKGFVYNCATCSYDLHMDCVRLPETVSRPDHEHPLSLSTDVSEIYKCDVCNTYLNYKAWLYYCSKCNFGTHLECVHTEIEQQNVSDKEEEAEIEQETVSDKEEEAEIEQANVSDKEEEAGIEQENLSGEDEEEAEIEQSKEEEEDEDEEDEIEQENVSDKEEEEAEIEQSKEEEDEEEEEDEIEQENVSDKEEEEEEEEEDIAVRLLKLQQQQEIMNFRLQLSQQNAQFVNSVANSWRNFL